MYRVSVVSRALRVAPWVARASLRRACSRTARMSTAAAAAADAADGVFIDPRRDILRSALGHVHSHGYVHPVTSRVCA
ncbi:MAG: hypothetical protein EOO41_02300 [Methanobacteriota archaeon]|nr:MAG: hypothetical protein EOO41_02300 [Euryarchaeota archaeon]